MGRRLKPGKKSRQDKIRIHSATSQPPRGRHVAEHLEPRTLLSLSPVSVPIPSMTTGSIPTNFIQYNGLTYFSNNSATAGNALWKTDGTAAGTSLVLRYSQSQAIETEAVTNNKLYFVIYDAGTNQSALWETSGTQTGTALVQTFPGMIFNGDMAGVDGTLFFSAPNGNKGWQLWKTDGTTAGTVVLTDINAPRGLNPFRLTDVNGTLFFSANDGINGFQLWKSDGTSAGTVMVADIPLGSDPTGPWYLTNVNGTLYFTANDAAHGWELWKTDGTANGTVLVDDIIPGRNSSSPSSFINLNGTLFFTANSLDSGLGLWKTDGTATGTVKVADVPGSTVRAIGSSADKLFLIVNTVPLTTFPERDALYCTDGSARDLQLLASNTSQNLAVIGNEAFFTAWTPQYGSEPWRTDGTLAGTQVLADILPGGGSSNPQTLVAVGSQLFLAANDGIHGLQLWKSDGTAAGTEMVSDMGSAIQDTPGVGQYIATIADEEYFISAGTLFGHNLTTGQMVPLCDQMGMRNFTVSGTSLYFTYSNYPPYTYLMRTDGTAAGTVGLGEFASIASVGGPPSSALYARNGEIYFNATVVGDTSGSQSGLWQTDGSLAGTRLLSNTAVGAQLFTPVGTELFFFSTVTGSTTLWETDGTSAGTHVVGTGYAGPLRSPSSGGYDVYPAPAAWNGRLVWESLVGVNEQFFITDGTAAGTEQISAFDRSSNLPPYQDSTDPTKSFVVLNGALYYANISGLWQSDGTPAGTHLLKSVVASYGLTVVGSYLFFIQSTPANSYTLWRTDGTVAGTIALTTFNASSSSTAPAIDDDLVDVNGEAYFSVPDASNPSRKDLWASDGTPIGTVLVAGNVPQIASIQPTIRFEDGNLYVQEYNVGLGGDFLFTPSVRGRVIDDANNNGTLDPSESGLSGVTVYLDLNNNGLLDAGDISEVTGRSGYYTFAVLPAGTYTIRQVVPVGYAATGPLGYSGEVVLTDGQSASEPVFGDVLISSIVMDDAYYMTAANNFGKQATFATGDVNGDGTVNLADILLIMRNLGQPLPVSLTQPTPPVHTLTARRRV